MTNDRRRAFVALTLAGVLWGTTVPMSKVALDFLDPAWLAFFRFFLAGICLLAIVSGPQLRAVMRASILVWGAVGYGGSILVQNIGVAHTSVTHAALLVGMTPILVAAGAAAWSRSGLSGFVWAGAGVSVAGVGLVASGHGSGSTLVGDALVLVSLVFACSFMVAQGYLLPGRDPVAVTAVQLVAAAVVLLPIALVSEGLPTISADMGAVSSTVGLALLGTLAPFVLFAYGQGIVPSPIAGAFVNIEPLVGVAIAAVLMGETMGLTQGLGAVAIVAGLILTSRDQLRRPAGVMTAPDERFDLAGC